MTGKTFNCCYGACEYDNKNYERFRHLDILERLCASSFDDNELCYMQHLKDEFIPRYLNLYQKEKPKLHFIRHYARMTYVFGPLIKTLRFEAKNVFLKDTVKLTKQRKNLCFTIAKHHQMWMYLRYKEEHILKHTQPKVTRVRELPLEYFSKGERTAIKNELKIEVVTFADAVTYTGQTYRNNEVVVLRFRKDEYVFGLIKGVLFTEINVYLLCQVLSVTGFTQHYHAYETEVTDPFEIISIDCLMDYHPYEIDGKYLVPLRYFIPQRN